MGLRAGVELDFSRPGKPTDNARVESFNGRLRQECLNAHWFLSLDDAQAKIAAWRTYYNESRPHSALDWVTPAEFARNCRLEPEIAIPEEPEVPTSDRDQSRASGSLNPHVYLDTVLLVGGVGAQQPAALRGWFIAGASSASLFWFALLGFRARWLAPWFARPNAWQVLDGLIGLTMLVLSALLIRHALVGL